jgi:translation initiation factor 1
MNLTFNNTIDLFSLDEAENFFTNSKVTICVQKRNGRKRITTITGMADDLDLKKIVSYFKKTYSCNGSILKDEKYGKVITFSGDQKENFNNFLIKEQINKPDDIIIKGA